MATIRKEFLVVEGDGSRFVWITDVLPDTLAPAIESMMAAGARVMRETLEATAAAQVR